MAVTREQQRETDKQVLTYMRQLTSEGDQPTTISTSATAKKLGLGRTALVTSLARLSRRNLLDYETGYGTITVVASQDGTPVRQAVDTRPHTQQTRFTCKHCGASGHNDEALYCWRCGKELRTPDEILFAKFSAIMARFPLMYGANTVQADQDIRVLREVANKAFSKKEANTHDEG